MIGDPKRTFNAVDRSGKKFTRKAARAYTLAVMIYPAHNRERAMRVEYAEAQAPAEAIRNRWTRAGFDAEIVEATDVTKPVQMDLPNLPPAPPKRWTRKAAS